MRRRRPIPNVGWMLLAMLAVASLSACGEQRRPNPAVPAQELPDQEVSDFALTETDDGRVAVEALRAQRRHLQRAQPDHRPGGPRRLLQRAGRAFLGADRPRGRDQPAHPRHDRPRQRRAPDHRGHAAVDRGAAVPEPSAEDAWSPTNQLVRVERGGDVLTGYGFESDPDLRHFEFKRAVKATVRSDTEGLVRPRDPE